MNISPPTSAPLKECARWMSLDYQWLYAHVRAGNIPAENRGSEPTNDNPGRARYWVKPSDVQAFLEKRRVA